MLSFQNNPITKKSQYFTSSFNFKLKDGFGLIEIVIVTAVISIALFSVLVTETVALRLLRNEKRNLEATLLAQEGFEAVRSVRDESWNSNVAWRPENQFYYPLVQSGKWILATSSPGLINGKYDRYIFFNKVSRDTQDRIVISGGTDDPGTRKITIRVTGNGKTITLIEYLTSFPESLSSPQEIKVLSFENASLNFNLAQFPSAANGVTGYGDPSQSLTTQSSAIDVTKLELLLKSATTSPSDIYAELRSESPTGTTLGTSTRITSSVISTTTLVWTEFRFSDAVHLNALTKYYIRLRSVPPSTLQNSGAIGPINWAYQSGGDPYGGGEAMRYVERDYSPNPNPNPNGEIINNTDFGFRVYALK